MGGETQRLRTHVNAGRSACGAPEQIAFLNRSGREAPDLSGGDKSRLARVWAGGALPIGFSATRREMGPANTEDSSRPIVGTSQDDGPRADARSYQCLAIDMIR